MNKVQWESVGVYECLALKIVTLEVGQYNDKWISWVMFGHGLHDDEYEFEEPHILNVMYNHPTCEDAKTYAIAKARELLLADLKQLET